MFTIKVTGVEEDGPVFELKTEARKLLKPTMTLLQANGYTTKVTEEVAPRAVKIKGVD